MARIVVKRVQAGQIVKGRFVPNASKTAFEKCVDSVKAKGSAVSPEAVCARSGRKKYGKKKFQALGAVGKALAHRQNPVRKDRMYKVVGGGAIKGVRFRKGGKVEVLVQPTKAAKNSRSKNLFGFGKAKRHTKRALGRTGYMVLDADGLPVHTGRDLSKREALQIAKDARKDGEKGIHLVKSGKRY